MKKISLLLLLPSIIWASIPIKHTPVLGGIAVIDFETNHANPQAFYQALPLYVQRIKGKHWQALLGIPLMEKPSTKFITIKDFSVRTFVFKVKQHNYQEQHITLKDKKKKYINLLDADIERIKTERLVLSKHRKTFSSKALSSGVFSRPVDGIITGAFGLNRFYNGKAGRPHTGLDYAGDIGTPIKASTNGRVILTGNYFFNGNTLFLDHGQGLVSAYIHLDKILVKQDQLITQGEIIGTIGKTGRATGPHLHWGVYLNRTAVNPNLLLGAQP